MKIEIKYFMHINLSRFQIIKIIEPQSVFCVYLLRFATQHNEHYKLVDVLLPLLLLLLCR